MYNLKEIASIIDGQLNGNEEVEISSINIDSRKVRDAKGALFFALKTAKDNGHRYIDALVNRGISAVVVSEPPTIECDHILVNDTLKALQQLAQHHRSSFSIPMVGITGSNGKTIVKEWLSHLCSDHFRVCKNPKSYNSQVGVPLSVWNLRNEHTLGIFEAGISEPGEMKALANIIRPTLGVFTHLGDAHDAQFDTMEAKLDEKLKLFKSCDLIVAGSDDLLVKQKIKELHKPCFFWGSDLDCDLRIIRHTDLHVELEYQSKRYNISLSSPDRSCYSNSLNAIAAALNLGVPMDHLVSRVAHLPVVDMRMQQVDGINNNQLILDFYNSDFQSISIALDFLTQQATHRSKTVILSDIVESQLSDDVLYTKLDRLLQTHRVDRLIGIGDRISQYRFNVPSEFYRSTDEFLRSFPCYSLRNESILLKGARVYSFERIAERLKEKTHQTVLEVNLSRLQENIRSISARLKSDTKLMTMVKALAYGSGGYQIAKLLEYNNIDYLGVAYTDEATALIQSGIRLPFIVLNPDLNDIEPYIEHPIQPVVYSFESLHRLNDHPVKIHLEFDTGMHRLGFSKNDVDDVIAYLKTHPNLEVVSVFSHLAGADEERLDILTQRQITDFTEIGNRFKIEVDPNIIMHLSNTAGIERFPEAQFDMVRLGIGLYGISSSGKATDLQPVSTFKTYINQIKTVPAGEGIGYGQHDIADHERTIAILAVGYADGFSRSLSRGVGYVMIHGKKARVVGNVCMDMTMVDVTDLHCQVGDTAVIFGDDPKVEDVARAIGTIPYEILTNVSERVNRVFYQE